MDRYLWMMFTAGVSLAFAMEASAGQMRLTSPAFTQNSPIPRRYSCEGQGINPELRIENVPQGTKSLSLIVDDPDAPSGMFVHWVVYDIPPDTRVITAGSVPGKQGANSANHIRFDGMCPPSGTHRYFFKLYALDSDIAPLGSADKTALESAMKGHVLDEAALVGTYSAQ